MHIENRLSVDDTKRLGRKRSRANLWIGAALIAVTGAMYAVSIDHAQREVGGSEGAAVESVTR